MTDWPTLYKKASTGKIQFWNIKTVDATIVVRHGQVDGKVQETRDTITKGKNVGRSNETTPAQQADAEAQSKWEKKQKSNSYHQSRADAESGAVNDDFVEGGILPMLAHKFSEQSRKIVYPAYVQPKLDGHRCIAMVADDGSVTLWSRTRKQIYGVPHIEAALEDMNLTPGTILDGELYNHDYRDRFNELTSFIRQTVPKDGHTVVQYHVYDMVNDKCFDERISILIRLLSAGPTSSVPTAVAPVVLVDTVFITGEDELTEIYAEHLTNGYEGAMVRNADSKYVHKRSYDLQKLKTMQDFEATVVDVVSGRGKMFGKGVFVCELPNGERFRAKMVGPLEDLAEYLENKDKYIGRELTVQYQDATSLGVPRFPVGLRFRDDL